MTNEAQYWPIFWHTTVLFLQKDYIVVQIVVLVTVKWISPANMAGFHMRYITGQQRIGKEAMVDLRNVRLNVLLVTEALSRVALHGSKVPSNDASDIGPNVSNQRHQANDHQNSYNEDTKEKCKYLLVS